MPVPAPNGSLRDDVPAYEDRVNVFTSTTPGVTAAAIAFVDPWFAPDDEDPGTAA
jgi:hypothetical protein